jgi:hypothetical protein
MLKKLREYFTRQTMSAPQSAATPTPNKTVIEEMRPKLLEKAIDQYWSSNFEVTKDFRVEFVRDVAGDIRQEGLKILASENTRQRKSDHEEQRISCRVGDIDGTLRRSCRRQEA